MKAIEAIEEARENIDKNFSTEQCVVEVLMIELENAKRENVRLRAIFPKILKALKSGACSPECSVEFMEMIPDEVRLVIRSLSLPNT